MGEKLRIELLKAMFNFKQIKIDLYTEQKLSMNDMLALDIIVANNKEKNKNDYFSEIQKFMKISKPAVSQLLASLEKRGLIEREIDYNDKRKFVLNITKETKKEMDFIKKEYNQMMDEMVEELGVEDTKELIRLFNKMATIAQKQKEKRLKAKE